MAVKGYVVRGTHRRGWPVFAYDHSGAFGGPSETDIPLHVFPSLDTASGARAHMVRCGCSDVAIFRVLDDGREERLPSYEEALDRLDRDDEHVKAIDHYREGLYRILRGEVDPIEIAGTYLGEDAPKSDPLATLEAAERRLLEAGGWKPGPRGRWTDPAGGNCSVTDAVYAEKRRLAAKGGA